MVRGLMKFVGSGSKTAYEMATGVLTYRTGVTAKAKELGVNFIKDPEGTIEEISQTVRNFDFKEVNRQVLDGLERGINDFIDASPEKQGEIFGEVVLANIITAGGGTFTKPYVHLTKAKHIRRTLDGVKATITKVCQIKIGRSRARRVAALRFAPSKLRSWLAGERLSPFAKRHLETVRSKAEDILINALLTPKQTVQKINNFIDATAEFDFEEFQSDPLAAAKKLSRGIAGDGKKKPEGSTGH